METEFDEKRAILLDKPEVEPFYVRDYVPIHEALTTGQLYPDEPCLVTIIREQTIVIPTLTMVYRHVAQGIWNDVQWVAVFCSLCNAGMVFDASVEGKVYHFAAQGYYDAMTLIADKETKSYWNHLKGTAIHGALKGQRLALLGTFEHLNAREAAQVYPEARVTIPHELDDDEIRTAVSWNEHYRIAETPIWETDEELKDTLSKEDDRLPRYDMGIGIWTDSTARYYPITKLYENANVILDRIDGRGIVIFMNEDVGLPSTFYLEADIAEISGEKIHFDAHRYYSNGTLYLDGQAAKLERPRHSVIRWYGFSTLFPDCEIYGM